MRATRLSKWFSDSKLDVMIFWTFTILFLDCVQTLCSWGQWLQVPPGRDADTGARGRVVLPSLTVCNHRLLHLLIYVSPDYSHLPSHGRSSSLFTSTYRTFNNHPGMRSCFNPRLVIVELFIWLEVMFGRSSRLEFLTSCYFSCTISRECS